MTSCVNMDDFLKHVPAENRGIHRELLTEIEKLDSIHARPSAATPNCYDVFIDGLEGSGLRPEHVLRVQGGHHLKNRDLKPVWLGDKLGNHRLAREYAARWASYVKSPDNPDSSEVKGGLQKIGVFNVIRILRETADSITSS